MIKPLIYKFFKNYQSSDTLLLISNIRIDNDENYNLIDNSNLKNIVKMI